MGKDVGREVTGEDRRDATCGDVAVGRRRDRRDGVENTCSNTHGHRRRGTQAHAWRKRAG